MALSGVLLTVQVLAIESHYSINGFARLPMPTVFVLCRVAKDFVTEHCGASPESWVRRDGGYSGR